MHMEIIEILTLLTTLFLITYCLTRDTIYKSCTLISPGRYHVNTNELPAHNRDILNSPKAALKVSLIAFAVSETRAGGFCPADATSIKAAVHLRLMKAKHL